jgi:predicted acylesterase/phospholipase RssA
MDVYTRIIGSVPLFRHCNDDEIGSLMKLGRLSVIRKGQTFDLKKISSFNVVVDGIFEIEALGRTDIVYLAPGSFFGNVPFTDNRLRGTIRAMVDSTLMLFPHDELYRFFLLSFKCLRGFIRTTQKMGFEMSGTASRFTGKTTSVIAVYSGERGAGTTLLSSALGLALGEKGKTIILDMSYGGDSVFTLFDRKITSPVSQKMEDDDSARALVEDRLEKVSDSLDILNIAHGSKVRVAGDILHPILFVLSQTYRYVVLDLSDDDAALRDSCFGVSDSILCLLTQAKKKSDFYHLADSVLRDFQRVYYVLNGYHSKSAKSFTGGYILERARASSGGGTLPEALAKGDGVGGIRASVEGRRNALVLESGYLNAAFMGGVLNALRKRETTYDLCYSSSLGYIVAALSHLCGDEEDFTARYAEFFQEERFNSFLDITFPDGYLFRQGGISKFADEVCGKTRIEDLHSLPAVLLGETVNGGRHIFSTGYFRDMVAASFLQHPLFEAREIAGKRYGSGFPGIRVRAEDLFRTDSGEVLYVSVNNSLDLGFPRGKVLPLFRDCMGTYLREGMADSTSELADRNLQLSVSEKDLRPEKILRISEDLANKLLKDIRTM